MADPILLQLTRSLLEAAAEDMGMTLQHVAFSANIKERRDFSCALFDAKGRLLAQAAHIPVHLGSMPASVKAVVDTLKTLGEGDVAVVNDPYAGGTHLPDITLVSPITARAGSSVTPPAAPTTPMSAASPLVQ
jgi:N-methylhydantoinase B